jgi:shikimate kinase
MFRTEGEQRFRQMETEALKRLAERCSVVTALGGGTFVDEKNREIIKQLGISIYLECTFETILAPLP